MNGVSQVPLLILALTMLSTLQLSINKTILYETSSSLTIDATFEAATISDMMLDEICAKGFGENSGSSNVRYRTDLTDPMSLGVDSGEVAISDEVVIIDTIDTEVSQSQLTYNDVDDYKGYTRLVRTSNFGEFHVAVDVYYVQESNTTILSNVQTFYKKIDVTVTHLNLDTPFVATRTRIYKSKS